MGVPRKGAWRAAELPAAKPAETKDEAFAAAAVLVQLLVVQSYPHTHVGTLHPILSSLARSAFTAFVYTRKRHTVPQPRTVWLSC